MRRTAEQDATAEYLAYMVAIKPILDELNKVTNGRLVYSTAAHDLVVAVLTVHQHEWTNEHGQRTADPKQATGKYGGGRCQSCGNVPAWCPTLLAIINKLGLTELATIKGTD